MHDGRESIRWPLLLIGDISVLYTAVWVTFYIRYVSLPPQDLLVAHLVSFTFLGIGWIGVFVLAGLYSRYTLMLRSRLPSIIAAAQTVNITIAALFFFAIPFFGITPKTILAIYLVVSTALLYVWRVYIYPNILREKKLGAVMLGTGDDITDLVTNVNGDPHHSLHFHAIIHPELVTTTELTRTLELLIEGGTIDTVVVDTRNTALIPLMPYLHDISIVHQRVVLLQAHAVYAEVFGRVPLSFIDEQWLLERLSLLGTRPYRFIKRGIDIAAGLILLGVLLCLLPFIALAMRIEGKGPIFITQTRIGKNTTQFVLYKLRSMAYSDSGAWIGNNENNYVTRAGAFLRRTHLDECAQGWNLLRGDVSLVGPRPDIAGLYDTLATSLPLYSVRYAVAPGITGWAQTTQKYGKGVLSPQSIEATRERLEYDIYYLLNRSLLLDLRIIVRTVSHVFMRA